MPGTPNIPVGASDFEERIQAAVPDRDTPVAVYCASPTCRASPEAAEKLERLGYREVYDFEAGMAGWKEAGFEVEGEQRLRVRVEAGEVTESEPA